MPSTIRDVAREAGVSVATVSRVFNDSGPVRDSTRRCVVEVASRLQYSPNTAARSLSLRRTHAVGVVLPDLHGHFFSEVIRGIEEAVHLSGYHVLIASSHNDRTDTGAVLRSMRGRVDGLILMAPELSVQALLADLPERLPTVLLNTQVEVGCFDSVTIDNYGGAYRMMSHLLALGHRRIALITGGERNQNARERFRAYRDALAAHDILVDPALIREGDYSERSGHAAAVSLLRAAELPYAIFAMNDAMALGALGALREAGYRVPEDVALAGFDDVPVAPHLNPPLTTVRVCIAELGQRAARRLVESLTGDSRPPIHDVLPTELVIRRSCGATPYLEER